MGRRKTKKAPHPRSASVRDARPRVSMRRVALFLAAGVLAVSGGLVLADWWTCLPDGSAATYVGRESCVECHAEETRKWTGSHHDLAMDLAAPKTVLGDFDNAEFTHFAVASKMFRKDGKYMIHTEGPDGKMADFEIKYVFGVFPLQQYMVEFDRPPDMPDNEIARVQVLRVSWDSKRKCWFYLPPPDVKEKLSPDDDLHWTGIAQRWNNMCADCHSTNLKKNYDVRTKTYHTTFSEIDVSCEACHGPASIHVELARKKSLFWDRKRGYGLAGLKDEDPEVEIQTCAPCHSRRRVVYPGFPPGGNYYDHYACELLQRQTYHPDGQILDEVYELGSFTQSKMYRRGIRCTNCHDPHTIDTGKMRREGNNVCTSCHQHPAGKYDSPAHHHHEPGSTGASCAACHMPVTYYMEVDPRLDHSLRVPRPDLSVEPGIPNACTRCHMDLQRVGLSDGQATPEYEQWLAAARNGDSKRVDQLSKDKMDQWYGDKWRRDPHFAHVLAAARRGEPSAEQGLIGLARNRRLPDIVRATALVELGQFVEPGGEAASASIQRLADPDPKVRAAAVANLQTLPDDALVEHLTPRLADPVRLVRTEAARVLARVPGRELSGAQRRALDAAIEEFTRGVLADNDRAGAHLTLGVLYENLGDDRLAMDAYQTAMRIEPSVSGPRTNLAALWDCRAEAAEAQARQALLTGDRASAEADRSESLRCRGRAAALRQEELPRLARDARLVPNSGPLQYRYGLSLYLHGRLEEAEQSLNAACRLEPNSPDFLLALALFYQKQERFPEALDCAERLLKLRSGNPTYQQLRDDLRSQASTGASPR